MLGFILNLMLDGGFEAWGGVGCVGDGGDIRGKDTDLNLHEAMALVPVRRQ